MKHQLLLIRHAKSDWENPSLSDFDRPLNVRGECDAPMMGERLAARDIRIERMVSSPARRARSTAEAIARSLAFPVQDIDWMTELYLANPAGMLDVIQACPDDIRSLALIGHNPGISHLASRLCNTELGELPTCFVAHLEAEFDAWHQAEMFTLVDLDYPKRND